MMIMKLGIHIIMYVNQCPHQYDGTETRHTSRRGYLCVNQYPYQQGGKKIRRKRTIERSVRFKKKRQQQLQTNKYDTPISKQVR